MNDSADHYNMKFRLQLDFTADAYRSLMEQGQDAAKLKQITGKEIEFKVPTNAEMVRNALRLYGTVLKCALQGKQFFIGEETVDESTGRTDLTTKEISLDDII